jgi:hypothetical protein
MCETLISLCVDLCLSIYHKRNEIQRFLLQYGMENMLRSANIWIYAKYILFSPLGDELEYLHCSPTGHGRQQKGNLVPRSHAVTGGHKFRDLVLQVDGWTQG